MAILTDANLLNFKDEFMANGCVKLPVFFNETFISLLVKGYSLEEKKRDLLEGYSSEVSVMDKVFNARVSIALNSAEFRESISNLLDIKIKLTKHRVYYIDKDCISLPWHDDSYAKDNRVAAMRFELSDEQYSGGDFLFRNNGQEFKFNNLSFGESVIFKVQSDIMYHKVESVTSGKRKSLSIFLCA